MSGGRLELHLEHRGNVYRVACRLEPIHVEDLWSIDYSIKEPDRVLEYRGRFEGKRDEVVTFGLNLQEALEAVWRNE